MSKAKREGLHKRFYRIFIRAELSHNSPPIFGGKMAYSRSDNLQEWIKRNKRGRGTYLVLGLLEFIGFSYAAIAFWLNVILLPGGNNTAFIIVVTLVTILFAGIALYLQASIRWMLRNWNRSRSYKIPF